jgi:hypothetical protein
MFRRGLARVLDRLVSADELTRTDADRMTTMISSTNARRIYSL